VGGLIVGGTLSAAALIALAVSTGGVAVALGACAAAAIGFTTIHDGISNAFANVKIMWSSSSKRKTQQKHIQNDIVSRLKPALAEKHKEIVKEAHKWLRNMIDAQAKLFNSSIDAKKKQFKTR
jgi:hypothetical protein